MTKTSGNMTQVRVQHPAIGRRLTPVLLLMALAVASVQAGGPATAASSRKERPAARRPALSAPLFFEENHGQADPRVKFLSRGNGYTLALTSDAAVLAVRGTDVGLLRVTLEGANRSPTVSGVDPLPGKIYYATTTTNGALAPNDTVRRVKYADAYPGVDLLYYGNDRELEFDFVVAPGANPRQIKLSLSGADKVTLDATGELAIRVRGSDVRLKRPVIYQERAGVRQQVRGGYVLSGKDRRTVSFALGTYDRSLPLVIDPTWTFGSPSDDYLVGLEVDGAGRPHVLSSTLDPTGMFFTDEKPGVVGPPVCVVSKLDVATELYSYVIVFKNMQNCDAFTLSPNGVTYFAGFSLTNTRAATIASVNESSGVPVVSYFTAGNYDSSAIGEGISAIAANSLEHLFLLGPCRIVAPGEAPLELTGWNETPEPATSTTAEGCTQPQAPKSGVRQPILTVVDSSGHVLYASFLSPGEIETRPFGLAADNSDRAYMVGRNSLQLPVTVGGASPDCATRFCAYLLALDTTTTGPASLLHARYLWRLENAESMFVRLGAANELYVAADGQVFDDFPNNRPTNPYPWSFTRFPDTKEGLQLARLDLDSNGVPSVFQYAFIFNAWTALAGTFRDHLTDLRVLPSGAPVIASVKYETNASTTATRGTVTTFYPSGELLAQRSEYVIDPQPGGGDRVLVAPDHLGNLYTAYQLLRHGVGPDLDIRVEQIANVDPGLNTPPAFSANDVTVIAPEFTSGTFVNGFNYFYYDAEDGLAPDSGACDHAPGSFFFAGTTAVTCTFTDSGGLSVTGTFNVIVNATPYSGAPFVGLTATPPDSTTNAGLFFYTPVTITATTAAPDARATLTTRLDQNPPIPPNLQAGSPPIYFELDTTRAQGPYTLCVDTSGMSFPAPSTVRLYHFERPPVSDWVDVTSAGSPNGSQLCGTSVTLGTFAIFYPQVPVTAIETIAGNGTRMDSIDGPGGNPSDDFVAGPAKSTPLGYLFGGAYDRTRNLLYFSDQNYILRLNLATNTVARIAGNGAFLNGIDGPGGNPNDDYVEAGNPFTTYVGFPWEMVVDPNGDLIFADRNTCRIRRLDMAANQLMSVAGNGTCGYDGDGFNALNARLSIGEITVDAAGNLFLADRDHAVIRRVDHVSHIITTVAGDGTFGIPATGSPLATISMPLGLAVDRDGYLLVAGGLHLLRISPGANGTVDGGADETMRVIAGCNTACTAPFGGDALPITDPRVFLSNLGHMEVARDGGVIFPDVFRIRRIAPGADGVVTGAADEVITTIASYFDFTPNVVSNYNGDTFATQSLLSPSAVVAEDTQGRLLVVDTNNSRVRRFGIVANGSASSADLEISVQDTPDPIATGARLDYTVHVENHGPADATGVTLTHAIAAGAEFHSVSGGSCTTPLVGSAGTVTCDLGSLAGGASRNLTISVTPRNGGTLAAQFTVTTTAPDPNPGNNTALVTTTVVVAPAVLTIVENILVTDAPALLPSVRINIAEQIHVTDDALVLPSAMIAIQETIVVHDAPTAAAVDTTPPVVTVPANRTVPATGPTGASVFWFASAVDNISGQLPVTCTPGPNATIPIGTTTVTCTATDAAGNVGSASFTITVIVGVPNMVIRITGQGRDPVGGFYLDMQFENNGTGIMPLLNLNALIFKTLTGTGTVTHTGGLTPFPNQLTNYGIGIGFGRLYLDVPTTVKRFSVTINGSFTNALGAVKSFSFGQAVIP